MTDTETTPGAPPEAGPVPSRAIFVAAILAGSFLLFLVQPMVARMALPRLGGAPAVWNSAMLVYQALLLGGYAYAHWLGRLPARRQGQVHLVVLLLAALWLPIRVWEMHLPANAEPALWVPWLFGASIGPLFFAIAAQAPLLQRWYSVASGGRDPYALYVASNFGSFAGLIAYPLIVEPAMALHAQSWLWTGGYALVLILVAACALRLPRVTGATAPAAARSPAPGGKRVGLWVALAFVPSGLMLATSTYITTDIVAVPLLWVLPLGLYLLSFTIAFASNRTPSIIIDKFAPVIVLMFGGMMISGNQDYPYINALMALILLFVVACSLHARMYALRPEPDRLTGFYLAMSVGGALGGVFAGLVAPVLFDWTYEYPILILAAGYLVPQAFLLPQIQRLWQGSEQVVRIKALTFVLVVLTLACLSVYNPGNWLGERNTNLGFIMIALVGLLAVGMRLPFTISLAAALLVFGGLGSIQLSLVDARTRSYFGVYTVSDFADQRRLAHGTTLHGLQLKGPGAMMPTTYYAPLSGVGHAMRAATGLYGRNARIGVVGLGTGTLSCYAIPGQQWQFYEIDPAVVGIARDSGKFSFLRNCLPNPRIVLGDARLSLAAAPPASLDLLALDAFSSDAVPMHLMTREAFDTYGRVLPQQGLLLVHISNRFLTLEPVVAAAAAQGGWHAAKLVYHPNMAERMQEATVSDWIALSRDPRTMTKLQSAGGGWMPLRSYPGFTAWSDDYATIVPVLRGTPWALPSD